MADDDDRLEREINEILDKIERFPAPEDRRKRAMRRNFRRVGAWIAERQRAVSRELSSISLSQLMLLSFLMILASLVLGRVIPFARTWLLLAGVALFIATFALMMLTRGKGGSPPRSQQWRGRTLEYRQESLAVRIRSWFRKRRQ